MILFRYNMSLYVLFSLLKAFKEVVEKAYAFKTVKILFDAEKRNLNNF